MEVLPPPPLLILVSEAHFKRKFVSKQIAVQKSICVWTLAAIAHLWEAVKWYTTSPPAGKADLLALTSGKQNGLCFPHENT